MKYDFPDALASHTNAQFRGREAGALTLPLIEFVLERLGAAAAGAP